MLNKGARWDLRSHWTVIPQRVTSKHRSGFLFEHVVTVTSSNSNVEVVARFLHSLARPRVGGLVSLVIRNRNRSTAGGLKRIDLRKPRPRFKAIDASPQSHRGGISSGNSSPVSAPLVLPTNPCAAPAPDPIKEDIVAAPALPLRTAVLPDQTCPEIRQASLPASYTADQTRDWLRARGFQAFESTFESFSAPDILRLSRDDLIQICGVANGIRLYNALAPRPRLSLYFAVEAANNAVGLLRAVYLESLTVASLTSKLISLTGLEQERLQWVLLPGSPGRHVLVDDDVVAHMKDKSAFIVESIQEPGTDRYNLLLKPTSD